MAKTQKKVSTFLAGISGAESRNAYKIHVRHLAATASGKARGVITSLPPFG